MHVILLIVVMWLADGSAAVHREPVADMASCQAIAAKADKIVGEAYPDKGIVGVAATCVEMTGHGIGQKT